LSLRASGDEWRMQNVVTLLAAHEAARAMGIKPIIGCEMGITTGSRFAPNSGDQQGQPLE